MACEFLQPCGNVALQTAIHIYLTLLYTLLVLTEWCRGCGTTSRHGLPRVTSKTKRPCKMPRNSSKWSVVFMVFVVLPLNGGVLVVICLEPGADLHTAQLMPLPLTVSCFSKIQTCFTFLVPADTGSPGQRAVKWVCLCCSAFSIQSMSCWRHYVFDMSVCACVCTCMPVESFPDQLVV